MTYRSHPGKGGSEIKVRERMVAVGREGRTKETNLENEPWWGVIKVINTENKGNKLKQQALRSPLKCLCF